MYATLLTGVVGACSQQSSMAAKDTGTCSGMCDASAVAFLDEDHFIAATDEDNLLRLYSRKTGGAPLQMFPLSGFMGVAEDDEADIEGTARIGEKDFWIASHGRNKNGKDRPARRQLLATVATKVDGRVRIQPVGLPYTTLLRDLTGNEQTSRLGLTAASMHAPKDLGGLNIEGLAATPEGYLLIGFRNPIPGGRALIIRLENPEEVIEGKTARFGDPILVDLGGLGIRGMCGLESGGYLIVAGPSSGDASSALYLWSGDNGASRRIREVDFTGLNPEAIALFPDDHGSRFLVLSDDGTMNVDGVDCKALKESSRQHFRFVELTLPDLKP